MKKSIDYNKNQSFEQRRAIIGDRHFILANEENKNCWVVPGGTSPVRNKKGEIIEKGKIHILTTKQLTDYAKSIGHKLKIIEDFPVIRHA